MSMDFPHPTSPKRYKLFGAFSGIAGMAGGSGADSPKRLLNMPPRREASEGKSAAGSGTGGGSYVRTASYTDCRSSSIVS
jgi:hypothetical protein